MIDLIIQGTKANIVAFALLLTACGGGSDNNPRPQPTSQWSIGPTIDGKQYSTGSINGNTITFGDIHYVTRPTGPLAGSVSISFHLSAGLTGTGCSKPGTASLYFQRKGDDWSAEGKFASYRWWSATTTLDHPGDYTLTSGAWTNIYNQSPQQKLIDAKANADKVGVTFGGCGAYGHGGTGPATLEVISFTS